MTTHTPGPWTVRYLTNVFADKRSVASTGGYATNGPDEEAVSAENVANACLIAAAPDLLAACKAIVDAHDGNDWSEPGVSDTFYAAIEQARAAIAKAREA